MKEWICTNIWNHIKTSIQWMLMLFVRLFITPEWIEEEKKN